MRALITAIRTLTILPVPGRDTDRFSRAVIFFPVAGALLACVPLAFYFGTMGFESISSGTRGNSLASELFGSWDFRLGALQWLVIAVMALGVTTILTGCLHLDGLADVADAIAPGRTRDRIMEILRDPRVGAFGVVAVVLVLLLKAACWAALLDRGAVAAVAVSLVASRSLQSVALSLFPSVSSKGLAVSYAEGMTRSEKVGTLVVAMVITAGATWFLPLTTGAVAMVLMWSTGLALAAWFTRRIGGINGDCVGAISECGEVAVLVVSSFLIPVSG